MRGLVERITPRGLRWRLAAWFTLVMLLCTGIVFFAVYHGTGTEVRRQIDRELAGEAAEFAHNLRTAGPDNPQQLAQAARRYLRTQPFSVSSTLLFAVVFAQRSLPDEIDAHALRRQLLRRLNRAGVNALPELV